MADVVVTEDRGSLASQPDSRKQRDRLVAIIAVAALHAVLGYALVTGLAFETVQKVSDNLKVFDVQEEPPPPPIEEPVPEKKDDAAQGAASAPNIKSRPTPVVAPPPKVKQKVRSPVVSVPEKTPVPTGSDPSAGNAPVAGPGSGSGGEGIGTGSGGSGTGAGSGGSGMRAQRISGQFSSTRDYPPAARRAGAEGAVTVAYTVGTDGRVTGCRVTRSSGNADLDAATCRIIEQRFRYRPAQDAQGRATLDVAGTTFYWSLPSGNR
jgi:periplasmic protein TonB